MSKENKYNGAVGYFNQASQSSLDDIRYTYDAEQNILIQHHGKCKHDEKEAGENAVGVAIAGIFAVSSTYKAVETDNWSVHGPDWSIGFMAIFAFGVAKHLMSRKRTVNTVDRNVQNDKLNQDGPVL